MNNQSVTQIERLVSLNVNLIQEVDLQDSGKTLHHWLQQRVTNVDKLNNLSPVKSLGHFQFSIDNSIRAIFLLSSMISLKRFRTVRLNISDINGLSPSVPLFCCNPIWTSFEVNY